MSMDYDPQGLPPPGQGYYNAQPTPRRQPPRGRRRSQERSVSPRGTEYVPYSDLPWSSQQSANEPRAGAGADARRESEVRPGNFEAQNQLAPYDDEKAWAEWNRAYGQEPAHVPTNTPLPQQSRRKDERSPRQRRRRSYEDDLEYADFRRARRAKSRHHERRDSTRSEMDFDEKLEKGAKDLGPALLGTAAGAFLGRKLVNKGALGIIGGAIAGGIGATAGERFDERNRRKQDGRSQRRREDDDRYYRRRYEDRDRSYASRRDTSPFSERSRDDESLPPRRRHDERSRRTKPKRYVEYSPDSYRSV